MAHSEKEVVQVCMFLLKIDQHFRGNDSWIARIDDSQVPEEEMHGGLELGVHTDEGDDVWVPCHSQSIDDQEDKEEWDLEVWTFWDSFEDKLSYLGKI